MSRVHTIHNTGGSSTETEEFIPAKQFKNYVGDFAQIINGYKDELRKTKQSKATMEAILDKKHDRERALKKKYIDALKQLKEANKKRHNRDIKKYNGNNIAEMLMKLREEDPLNKKEMAEEYKRLAKKYL